MNAFGVTPLWSTRTDAPTRQPTSLATNGAAEDNEEDIDLFEYFDPLLSPHAYPDGISPNNKPIEVKQSQREEDISPIVKKTFGFNLSPSAGGVGDSSVGSSPQVSGQRGVEQVDTTEVFDPRISPHEYTNGTPDKVFGFEREKRSLTRIGILLMDHGSRNPASNERLKNLARVYQESLNDSNVVVRYAHMEIAQPSIPESLHSLLEEGVDEIVCHPYFLSPGRHVKEDIPEIVQSAIERLDISIPIVTTNPVGSETDIMIRAIHSAVKRTAAFT